MTAKGNTQGVSLEQVSDKRAVSLLGRNCLSPTHAAVELRDATTV
jgi:hypothetical protein